MRDRALAGFQLSTTFLKGTLLRGKFGQESFPVFSPSFLRAPPRPSRPYPGAPGEPREAEEDLIRSTKTRLLLDLLVRRKFEKDFRPNAEFEAPFGVAANFAAYLEACDLFTWYITRLLLFGRRCANNRQGIALAVRPVHLRY